ncbi:hypothetical protein [Streptomyces luteireticuli]|uniref:Secreted protein n=1 Tax=Streptomyces luteireticuli TaxID=173858 RepID=A0ABP3IJJ9_9ACTN
MRHPISRLLAWTRASFRHESEAVPQASTAPPPTPITYTTPTTTVVFTAHGINIHRRGPHPRCTCPGAVHDVTAAVNSPAGAAV